ncbi:diacylglycerol kinase [Lysobacteraceae bacterium NML03-0222]|nr:diacylglycerol kinase [Xanthomonadaceae bacterium NML03-0222]
MNRSTPSLTLIAALNHDYVIGRDNQLPWRLPADLQRFKRLTLGKPVLMGRKTAQSLGRALPGRRNWVLTRSGQVPFAGMQALASLDEAWALAADTPELMVIGGGEIYRLTLPMATRLYLTWVDMPVADADAFFPQFDRALWRKTHSESFPAADGKPAYRFVDYQRET